MTRRLLTALTGWLIVALTSAPFVAAQTMPSPYYPDRFEWQRRAPAALGVDASALDEAVKFAIDHENPAPRDLALARAVSPTANEPFSELIGPMQPRAALNGLIVHRGYVVAEWGDTSRADMAFSVTKSFLSTVVGLAWQEGLIRDLTDPVGGYMPAGVDLFEAPHNRPITWDHLLRQTSDWQGALWGKPDWADRPEGLPAEWERRPLHEPGTRYKYNDVRVNVLALAALHVVRRPLPEVLRDAIMSPIGASSTWRWHGYENSWVEIDGQRMQSMTGGGHWGGGMFINAWDLARFGYLFLRNGVWDGRRLVSEDWIQMARTPGSANREYGYMNWFLNTGRQPLPAAPESSVAFRGSGENVVYIDWQNDLLVVVRWIEADALNGFIERVLAAVAPRSAGR